MCYLNYRVSKRCTHNYLLNSQKDSINHNKPNYFFRLSLILVFLLAVYFYHNQNNIKPFLDTDDFGNIQLAEWREGKLTKELEDLEQAEQYALVAKTQGNFPCYSCLTGSTIKLQKGETWRYGFTTKGHVGRYASSLEGKNLIYVIQYVGTIKDCLIEERKKIYYYALLPENLNRDSPLIRPPGNKQDS